MLEEYYSPSQIRFNRPQVKWLLHHLPELRKGDWPVRPEGSSYIDQVIVGKKRVRRKAPFIDAGDICGELEHRLERTGLDGLLVEAVYTWDKSIDILARVASMSVKEVELRMGKALEYITGNRRKREPYK